MLKVWSEDAAVLAEVEINAGMDRVFRAITDPKELGKWWGADDKYRADKWTTELKPGGQWRCDGNYADPGKTPFHVDGEVLELDPPRLLVHTWKPSWEPDSKGMVVRWELTDAGAKKTRLKIHHSGFAAGVPTEGYSQGWTGILGWLDTYLKG
jgi:uncharacterized protein YndB with AHSA1/START domain